MLNLSYTSPFKGEIKTLTLTKDPFYYGIGSYTDDEGHLWDIKCIFGNNGKPVVAARLVDDSSLYRTTGEPVCGSWTWNPYYFKVIKDGNKKV